MHLVVTGGCGFIGSHFIRHLLTAYPDMRVTNIDILSYAAHPDTVDYLAGLAPGRYEFLRGDICSPDLEERLRPRAVDGIVNFAAETHVDRSILDPMAFVKTNVLGVQNLLSIARRLGNIRFVQVSTDEVYGSLERGDSPSVEQSTLSPNSPYAASKAAADLLVLANARTYGQQALITRCSNNYGPFQFPEKLIPLVIANAIEDLPIPVYGDGKQIRDWIYVEDHCRAVAKVWEEGKVGEVYNISAHEERFNIDTVGTLLTLVGKTESLIQYVGDRPAHDRRYALDSNKIREQLGWSPEVGLSDGLARTVQWYTDNDSWWKKVRDKEYFQYYQDNYQSKFASKDLAGRLPC
jgi:dTDP-glucose 4,6-dehydratase